MKQIILLLLISAIFAEKEQQLITKDKWVNDLIELAKNRVTEYSSQYPYNNCLYYDGYKWITNDVNLHYALFNGRNIYDFTTKGCGNGPIITNYDTITSDQLINKCNDVSNDFTRLKEGEPRILYLNGHIGAYLGKVVDVNGSRYNVVEATGSFGYKIAFSWVDDNGVRRSERGGYTNGRWTRHGKPSRWVKY